MDVPALLLVSDCDAALAAGDCVTFDAVAFFAAVDCARAEKEPLLTVPLPALAVVLCTRAAALVFMGAFDGGPALFAISYFSF